MFRLDQEKDQCAFYYWLTLTYADEHVPRFPSGEMCFSKDHCRSFFEKIRKRYERKYKCYFKHFLVSEYGPEATHRPHYHLLFLVYNKNSVVVNYHLRKEMRDFILNDAWPFGHVTEKTFHGRVLSYLTKYCTKPELTGEVHTMQPFTLISRGIGLSLLNRIPEDQKEYMINNLDFTYRYGNGKIQLPRYYVDKIMPHSLQDLRNSVPKDHFEDPNNWIEFNRLFDIRSRLQKKQNVLAEQEYKKRENETTKEFLDRINYEYTKFRSKLKTRKNI